MEHIFDIHFEKIYEKQWFVNTCTINVARKIARSISEKKLLYVIQIAMDDYPPEKICPECGIRHPQHKSKFLL
jgi:hypothetical protein